MLTTMFSKIEIRICVWMLSLRAHSKEWLSKWEKRKYIHDEKKNNNEYLSHLTEVNVQCCSPYYFLQNVAFSSTTQMNFEIQLVGFTCAAIYLDAFWV